MAHPLSGCIATLSVARTMVRLSESWNGYRNLNWQEQYPAYDTIKADFEEILAVR